MLHSTFQACGLLQFRHMSDRIVLYHTETQISGTGQITQVRAKFNPMLSRI